MAFDTSDGVLAAVDAVAIYEPARDFQPEEARDAASTVVESSHRTRLPAVPMEAGPVVDEDVAAPRGQIKPLAIQAPVAVWKSTNPLAQIPVVHCVAVHALHPDRDPVANVEHAKQVEPDDAEGTSTKPDAHKGAGAVVL